MLVWILRHLSILTLILIFKDICIYEVRRHVCLQILRLTRKIHLSGLLYVVLNANVSLFWVNKLRLKHLDVVELIVILLKKSHMLPKILFVQNSSWCDGVNVHARIWSILCEHIVNRRVNIVRWEPRRINTLLKIIVRRHWEMDWVAISWNGANCWVYPLNIWTYNLYRRLLESMLIEAPCLNFTVFVRDHKRWTIYLVLIVILLHNISTTACGLTRVRYHNFLFALNLKFEFMKFILN